MKYDLFLEIETSEKLPLAKPQRREDSVFRINLRLCASYTFGIIQKSQILFF